MYSSNWHGLSQFDIIILWFNIMMIPPLQWKWLGDDEMNGYSVCHYFWQATVIKMQKNDW